MQSQIFSLVNRKKTLLMNIKLRFFCLLFAVFVCYFSQAQDVHFGFTADVNLAKMNAKGLSSKTQTGYNGGGFATIDFTKKWSLQPEVLYTLVNAEKADNFSTYYINSGRSFANTDINLHYLSIPVFLNYHISKLFTVNAGPEYSVMMYSNDDLLKSNKTAFKKTQAGVAGGVQFAFSPAFGLFGSYYYSLSDINNIDDRYQWHNSQARIGIQVRLL